jgi:hypothetical protein
MPGMAAVDALEVPRARVDSRVRFSRARSRLQHFVFTSLPPRIANTPCFQCGRASYGLRQNKARGFMWKWFSRRPAPNPNESAETIRQRLQAARLLVQTRKERSDRAGVPTREDRRNRSREILPSKAPDAAISCEPMPSPTTDSTFAAALESILQGQRVGTGLCTQLYRGGFVFKDPAGQWTITGAGKELIEKHKLITPDGCLVAGVRCAAGWNK